MQGMPAVLLVERTPHRLAVDRHMTGKGVITLPVLERRLHPAHEAAPKAFRIDQAEHPPERVMGRDARRQSKKTLEPGFLRSAVILNVDKTIRLSHHRTNRDHQNIDQTMLDLGWIARVFTPLKTIDQSLQHLFPPPTFWKRKKHSPYRSDQIKIVASSYQ